jgi:DNA-binding CsgD family transcriptional regulator
MLDRTRYGDSTAVVLRGEAGIGKTTLLDYCARQASGCHLARIASVQSELEMPYAAIHQLCSPMLKHLDALPEPQQNAVKVAFDLLTGSAPDRFAMGLAVLSLLAEAATEQPLVCLVDDAQWLDEPSRQVLTFVGRRLVAEGIMLVLAERSDDRQESALPTLDLTGLDLEDAQALLKATTPGHLDDQVRDRIVAETRGNPLQLLELPRLMGAAELAGGFGEFDAYSAATQLAQHDTRRMAALPAPSRGLLLLAATDPTGDAALLWRAARRLGIAQDASIPARTERLLTIGERVSFRHPLIRSTAYARGSPDERRAAHAALAESTDEGVDPERRIWHLAAAASQPDEAVAAELVRTAGTAVGHAGLAAAAAFLERASVLTPDPLVRTDRGLDAIEAHVQAGELEMARCLLAQTAGAATTDLQLARVEQLAGQIDAAATSGREAPVRLLRAAKRLETLDLARARDTYLQAWWASILAGDFASPGGDTGSVATAVRAAPAATDPGPADLLLDGLAAAIMEDPGQAAKSLRRGLDSFRTARPAPGEWVQLARSATTAAFTLLDADAWVELSTRDVELARESGALAALVAALNHHVTVTTLRGDFKGAEALVAELDAVEEDTGILEASFGTILLAAYRGKSVDALSLRSVENGDRVERGAGYCLRLAGWGDAIANNGLGRYAAALAACRASVDQLVFDTPVVLAEMVEAAVRDDQPDLARDAHARLAARTKTGTQWAYAIEARAHALVVDDETAERWYAESIDAFGRTPLVPDLARSHLVYGEWLRRRNRLLDAREHLKIAYETFRDMGAEGFSERARRELAAAGVKMPKQRSETSGVSRLTEQEEQIARLARIGRTNAEIGAELFLSIRTVEWHLRKVFMKLGIASRRDLRYAIPEPPHP